MRPDGTTEAIGCSALVLACSGFGGNSELVQRHIPEMADALFFGHAGNKGDAVAWGTALGAATRDMGAYQGHGSVATPHNILITWALMMEGGIQVNAAGKRFSNEHQGYSEQSVAVLAQPGRVAFNIYDHRRHELGLQFEDYRQAVAQGAIKSAVTAAQLAVLLGLPADALSATIDDCEAYAIGEAEDRFGRDFTGQPAADAAVLRGQGHRRLVPYARRAARRRRGAGLPRRRLRPAQPVRRRRCRRRRLGAGRVGLSVGQRPAFGRDARKDRRRRSGAAHARRNCQSSQQLANTAAT